MKIYDDAIVAINEGREVPKRIGDFWIKYKSTDGWRGYYYAEATKKSGWSKESDGWITGDWEDAGDNAASKKQAEFEAIERQAKIEGKEVALVYCPTSNVFSTAYDIFTQPLLA